MPARGLLILLAVVVLAAGGYLVYRHTRPPATDQQQIHSLILKAARALEQRRVSTFLTVIADDYNDGTHTKQDLARLARSAVLEAREIRIVPYLRSLEVRDTTATTVIEAEVTLSPTAPGSAFGEAVSERYTVRLTLAKRPRGWQVTSAQGWQGAEGQFGSGL